MRNRDLTKSMKRMTRLLMTLFTLTSCVLANPDDGDWAFYREHHSKQSEDFRRKVDDVKASSFRFLPEVSQFIQKAEEIWVFEGLPHQTWEPELLEREKATKKTIAIGAFPFYAEPVKPSPNKSTTLRTLLTGTNGLMPMMRTPMCGGFHPDFAIRFRSGDKVCDVLICNGCGEATIEFGNRKVYGTLKSGWEEALDEFRKLRPLSAPANAAEGIPAGTQKPTSGDEKTHSQ